MTAYEVFDSKCEFNLKNTSISRCFFIRFLRSRMNILHSENIRSTKACDTGAEIRSSATGTSRGYTANRCYQEAIEFETDEVFRISIRYFYSSTAAVSTVSVRAVTCVASCLA